MNSKSPLIRPEQIEQRSYGLEPRQFEQVVKMVFEAIKYSFSSANALREYLEGWRKLPGLPSGLCPPTLQTLNGFGGYLSTEDIRKKQELAVQRRMLRQRTRGSKN